MQYAAAPSHDQKQVGPKDAVPAFCILSPPAQPHPAGAAAPARSSAASRRLLSILQLLQSFHTLPTCTAPSSRHSCSSSQLSSRSAMDGCAWPARNDPCASHTVSMVCSQWG